MRSSYRRAVVAALITCGFVLTGLGPALGASASAASAEPGAPSGCGCEPAFTIEKRQQIEGSESAFTTSPLLGATGERVNYEIIVENTGVFPESFSEFSDPNCEQSTIAGGPGTSLLSLGESATYTCSLLLGGPGRYTNEATVTGTSVWGMPLTQTSNQVVVEVPSPPPPPPPPSPPKLAVEKLQQVAGALGNFTTAKLTAGAGQTLNYHIVVTNTGTGPLTISAFSDQNCDQGTLTGGPGSSPLAAGEATTYSCTRYLRAPGSYTNVATVTGRNGEGESVTETSNQVETIVPESHAIPNTVPGTPKPIEGHGELPFKCEAGAGSHVLRGASGPKRKPFTVVFSSLGIARIAFYVDGRKIKLLTEAQAKHGSFTIRIDPRKLGYGKHRVAVTTRMTNRECTAVAASSVFTDPRPVTPPPG